MHPIKPLISAININAHRAHRLHIRKWSLRRKPHSQFIPDEPFRTVISRIPDFQRFILLHNALAFRGTHIGKKRILKTILYFVIFLPCIKFKGFLFRLPCEVTRNADSPILSNNPSSILLKNFYMNVTLTFPSPHIIIGRHIKSHLFPWMFRHPVFPQLAFHKNTVLIAI